MSTPIAFFDMDRTLLAVNTGNLWIRAEVRSGHLKRRAALRGLWHIGRYHLGFSAIEPVIEDAIRLLAGTPEAALADRTEAFYHREVAHRVRPGAIAVIADHVRQGHRLALLTTSSNYMARPVADALAVDDILCSRFEVDATGHFTGDPIRPLCFGAGKVVLAQAYADSHGVDLADCWFYSDSASDLPMLERVGHPVAVHPDPRLTRRARQAGWPIARWDD
ncbi:MAG: HAD superfamily hydrolase (TIGR01490 family) [Bradymonadia bacterium]|jgi:HAD superfamily hydrolase (TIGR01490 family)